MPESTPAGNNPMHSSAYGPIEDADATRQSQHTISNDAPVDVNNNSIIGRSQALTVDALGKAFASNQDRRDKIADAIFNKENKA